MRRFPLLLAAAIALARLWRPGQIVPGATSQLAIGGAPGAAHAGIYLAVQRGFDEAEGVTLHPEPVAATRRARSLRARRRWP